MCLHLGYILTMLGIWIGVHYSLVDVAIGLC